MRYVLIDNAVVQCDNIENHIILDTSRLFEEEKEYSLFSDYETIFNAIKTFLLSDRKTHELFVSTHFYFVPCFVSELQKFLGESIRIIPTNIIANSTNMIENYDCHSIRIVFDNGIRKCAISKNNIKERAKQVVKQIVKDENLTNSNETGISCIIKLNNCIENFEVPLSLKDFTELIVGDDSYTNLVTGKEGFINFSPFGSLRYYDELSPRVYGFDIFHETTSDVISKSKYSYVMSTLSGDITFNNRYQTWINTEKGGTFPIKCMRNSKEKWRAFMIPDPLVEKNEIQIGNMCFGKFFVDMQSDYFGNLHLRIESLNGQLFFQTLQFAL